MGREVFLQNLRDIKWEREPSQDSTEVVEEGLSEAS